VEDEKVITDWNVKEREERKSYFFFIKIYDWEATVLPNVLGSTVASQG
jgi:hypothetical protein